MNFFTQIVFRLLTLVISSSWIERTLPSPWIYGRSPAQIQSFLHFSILKSYRLVLGKSWPTSGLPSCISQPQKMALARRSWKTKVVRTRGRQRSPKFHLQVFCTLQPRTASSAHLSESRQSFWPCVLLRRFSSATIDAVRFMFSRSFVFQCHFQRKIWLHRLSVPTQDPLLSFQNRDLPNTLFFSLTPRSLI